MATLGIAFLVLLGIGILYLWVGAYYSTRYHGWPYFFDVGKPQHGVAVSLTLSGLKVGAILLFGLVIVPFATYCLIKFAPDRVLRAMIFALAVSPVAMIVCALWKDQTYRARLRQNFQEHPVKLIFSAVAMFALCGFTLWIAVS